MRVYTVTASYGEYEDRCDIDMFSTTDSEAAKEMMATIIRSVTEAMIVNDEVKLNCAEPIWNLARHAHWDGEVHVSLTYMDLGVLSYGVTHVESNWIHTDHRDYYRHKLEIDQRDNDATLYEIMARPYEMKFFGEKIH